VAAAQRAVAAARAAAERAARETAQAAAAAAEKAARDAAAKLDAAKDAIRARPGSKNMQTCSEVTWGMHWEIMCECAGNP